MTGTIEGGRTQEDRRSAGRSRRRPLRSRLSNGHVLMLTAGLVAAVANFAALRSQSVEVPILVARDTIAVGTPLTPGAFETVYGRLGDEVLGALLPPGEATVEGLGGRVAAVEIPAGAPIRLADLRAPAVDQSGLRRMSIPIRREHAVGGDIRVEDRVDVIRVVDGRATYVTTGARVLAVAGDPGGALGLAGFSVTIAVDPDTALCLAAAMQTGQLSMVLSTGQEPLPAAPCEEPA